MLSKGLLSTVLRRAPLVLCLLLPATGSAQDDPARVESNQQEQEESPAADRRVRRLGDVAPEEWQMDLSMPDGAPAATRDSEFDLPDEAQNARLQSLLSRLASRSGDQAILAELDQLLDEVLVQADELANLGRLDEMQQLLGVVRNVNPQKSRLSDAFQKLDDLRNVGSWLLAASQAMDDNRIIEPEGSNALHFLGRVLDVDPDNSMAEAGLLRAQRILIERALVAAQGLDFELAEEWLYEASLVREPQELVQEAEIQVQAYQAGQVADIEQRIIDAIEAQNYDAAEFTMIDLIALVGNDERVQSLRKRLTAARIYGRYNPGEIISDGLEGFDQNAPAVVVIKPGSFLMGSSESDSDRKDNEEPQHRVTLQRGFGMGLHEVTVEQFRLFAESRNYRTQAETVGHSRVYDEKSARIVERDGIFWMHDYEGKPAADKHPVLHVDWYDAQAYVEWLSEQTGQRFRLPTEAEFEYAIRAGTVSAYWWGDERPGEVVENITGGDDESSSGRRWTSGFRDYDDGYWGPAPVASFMANPLGIYDLAGNVSEWVEDCWHPTYTKAPADGSAWVNPGCERRVVRGGYWASSQYQSRSAARISGGVNLHGPRVGFRVARDL